MVSVEFVFDEEAIERSLGFELKLVTILLL